MTRSPGLSLRLRLAASYAAFVVVVGVVLFTVGVLALRFVPDSYAYGDDASLFPSRSDLLEVFVRYSLWGLVGLAVLGVGGGWLLAGWMLRPLGRIGAVVASTSAGVGASAFSIRIRLPGRRDELTDLADAFDGMLDRVERSVESERRLAANASHELRTPLAVTRALLEVARADPDGRDVDRLLERLAVTNERSIALAEATLALARVDRVALERDPVDLAEIVRAEIEHVSEEAAARGIRIDASLPPAIVEGHAGLLAQLAGNLLRNAVRHNVDGGGVEVSLAGAEGRVRLTVESDGAVIPAEVLATLTEPFVRGVGRTRQGGATAGTGLGLAIVQAVAEAHDGLLAISARPAGGLTAVVTLPATAPRHGD